MRWPGRSTWSVGQHIHIQCLFHNSIRCRGRLAFWSFFMRSHFRANYGHVSAGASRSRLQMRKSAPKVGRGSDPASQQWESWAVDEALVTFPEWCVDLTRGELHGTTSSHCTHQRNIHLTALHSPVHHVYHRAAFVDSLPGHCAHADQPDEDPHRCVGGGALRAQMQDKMAAMTQQVCYLELLIHC